MFKYKMEPEGGGVKVFLNVFRSSSGIDSCAIMGIDVCVEVVKPRKLAAVRRQVPVDGVATAWRPALDQVWAFLRSQPGLRTDGHNIFLYQHPPRQGDPLIVDFGVEVTQSFSPSGEVHETTTPSGEDMRSRDALIRNQSPTGP